MEGLDVVVPGPLPTHWWALHVSGELDIATAPDLEARLGRALAQHHGAGIVLDLSAVTFLDCAGLRPVIRARNRLAHRLCLRGVHGRVARLMDLADVTDSLRILPDAQPWPPESEPEHRGVVLDDLFDHRPARPVIDLTDGCLTLRPSVSTSAPG
jgi:anti-anti-sigma factor